MSRWKGHDLEPEQLLLLLGSLLLDVTTRAGALFQLLALDLDQSLELGNDFLKLARIVWQLPASLTPARCLIHLQGLLNFSAYFECLHPTAF